MKTLNLLIIAFNVYTCVVAYVFHPLYGQKISDKENNWMPGDNRFSLNNRRNIYPFHYTELDEDDHNLYKRDLMTEKTNKPNSSRAYRLPDNFYPTQYYIELQPHIYGEYSRDFFFNGSVIIEIKCVHSTNEIIMHSDDLIINEQSVVILKKQSQYKPIFATIEYDLDRQFVILKTDQIMEGGLDYVLSMGFRGPLTFDLKGLYLSFYNSGEKTRGNNWVVDYYDTTPKMSTYTLAFTVCDFNFTSVTKNNITFRTWARPDLVHTTPYALHLGVDILAYFEEYSNIQFPLTKSDMIAVPDFPYGGMENWGLIIYDEFSLLYDPVQSSVKNKMFISMVVSHEIAHQWFGNLVTSSWWGDLWLNEGFASFFQYMALDKVYPDWSVYFIYLEADPAFTRDEMLSSRPVYTAGVSTPKDILGTINGITYNKGACVVRMLHFFLGEGTFRRGIQRYLNAAAYDVATRDDLFYALGNQSVVDNTVGGSVNVKNIMDTWILQKNFPLVTVARDGNDLILKQSRFLYDQTTVDTDSSQFGYKWTIPFTFTTSLALNFNQTEKDVVWMDKDKSKVILPDVLSGFTSNDWYIANVMLYGYYRVNYPIENWKNIINQLKTDYTKIHPINRAQIIYDAWALSNSGKLNIGIALQTTEYLSNEDYIGPFVAVKSQIGMDGEIDKLLQRTEVYGAYSKFMRALYKEPFRKFGVNNNGSSHTDKLIKEEIVPEACYYDNEECRNYSLTSFKKLMEQNASVNAEFKEVVYCTAIRHGGEDEWNFAHNKYKSSSSSSEKRELMEALTCSREVWILNRYLKYTLIPEEVRTQDINNIIELISLNPTGQSLAWQFLQTNWDVLYKEHSLPERTLKVTTQYLSTKVELQSVLDFKSQHPDLSDSLFNQAIEKIENNIEWMKDKFPVIKAWLSTIETI